MTLTTDMLDSLCPMHVVVTGAGAIQHVGGTLQKLRPDQPLTGAQFLDVFEIYRPRRVNDMAGMLACSHTKLHLRFRAAPRTALKGLLVPGPVGGAVINLSFGIGVVDAVHEYSLTSTDFAATDLTIEMLYLVEAKSAAMEASRTLNKRLQGAMVAAEERAFTDTLTGLKNRRAMDYVLDRLVSGVTDFALLHLDLDFFKTVNDSLGHAAGDYVLQQVAGILVNETRKNDTVARVGGDEFVVLFAGLADQERLTEVARRIITELDKPMYFGGQSCRISGSVGITIRANGDRRDAMQLMQEADMALYASKRAGRACHTFFNGGITPMREVSIPVAE
ncbi:diguanylate cyclase domain-containing protein [Puniceibacterium sp. IMCC21224]|uniref:diguanylate cyclase domain-containing protein n=1 Tax=Puniceibacterium sp. IMCC21224 TaxID=1618204 RepID=UPI00065D1A12|nr:diguanylate cyclase (GGDEF) domain-containing protein [Puniceibacterium sp. IMCC21224]